MTHDNEAPSARADLGATRLLIGLAQGVALLLLIESGGANAWPANDPWAFSTILLAVLYVPLTVLVGLGQLRPATLALWIVGCIALIAGLSWHAVSREPGPFPDAPGVLVVLMVPLLFVAYHLVAASDTDGRVPARYRCYFDIAWKNGVQLALSLAFLGAFWLLLYLGALLFGLIRIELFAEIIRQSWFIYPVTATMFALAVHLTDVRVGIINGIRAVALVLLSWLLPFMTVLAVAFLAALPATGLEPLWATGSATAIVLAAAGTLIILINAAYQDGAPEAPPHRALQIAARVAGLAIVPLVLIAAYSVWLRVDQHGLTPERVVALGILAVAAVYTTGYAISALWPGQWFKPLELTNFFCALLSLGLVVAMLTPLGDPARLSVDDQVRRLRAGFVTPDQFDYNFLAFSGARYGRDALEALARDTSTPRAQAIATKAQQTLGRKTPEPTPPEPSKNLIAKIVVRPSGQLPESFVTQDWSKSIYPPIACVRAATPMSPCSAYLVDLDGDGANEILVGSSTMMRLQAYQLSAQGVWRLMGHFETSQCGVYLPNFLDSGRFQLVPAKQKEFEIDGQRLRLQGCAE